MLEIREKHIKERLVFSLVGSLDTHSVPDLQQRLLAAIAQNSYIVLDLTGLTYISSSGVALFIRIGNRCRALGGYLRLAGAHSNVKQTLAVLRLDSHELIFQIVPTVEEALKD